MSTIYVITGGEKCVYTYIMKKSDNVNKFLKVNKTEKFI